MEPHKTMNTEDLSPVNEWNHYRSNYAVEPLADCGDSAEDWTNGMIARLPPVPNRNGQGQMQGSEIRLLMEKQANDRRKIRV